MARRVGALMVQRTYQGLGSPEAAARDFEALRPYVRALWGLQAAVGAFTRDGSALDIAVDSLQTAAFHFTRRPRFYEPRDPLPDARDLRDRAVVAGAFEALRPYAAALRHLQSRCRPFGRDWLALDVAVKGLETTAFHFTGVAHFYGSRGDSAGPVRPPDGATP
ncbi:MAG: hypothetical protein A2790_20060 [Phenylobacterium sp. RIFCSPHIGHO2_01_FULL_69_31]|uniref:hypothetical protein n=1 Tax=Phenylobacterium sp. RIFCSPHIGHO2_01_FULL_69_31 TaxID=1801944 RepID=UPI0008D83332|nr:hypothetical protein [Phenylobacterium sp. RIFCSPHIGHO2_01_FULL_69_31]OHB26263.1 MAG: hypothetical protein A2790_20060 [Phenylobacterium sp. RIFCSPHIGHO2_01_FULL_69_31]